MSISPPPSKRRRVSGDVLPHQTGLGTAHRQQERTRSKSLRIFSWNINGIASFLQPSMSAFVKQKAQKQKDDDNTSPVTSLRQVLRRHDWPELFLLQEVKMSPDDEGTKRAVERAVNRSLDSQDDGPSYTTRFCLPRDKFNARGFGRKVYGVATIIRDDYFQDDVEEVREVEWDLEGRVLLTLTKSKVAIFNIYAVNGTDNTYKDPLTGKPSGTRHDRKLAFHRLLVEEGRRLEESGYSLIIAGDLNVAPAPIDGFPSLRTKPLQHVKNREDFHARFLSPESEGSEGLGLVDSFRHLHPHEKKYTWIATTKDWLTSCDRVDHVLVSKSLVTAGALRGADIHMMPADRGRSDHVPVHVRLSHDSVTKRSK